MDNVMLILSSVVLLAATVVSARAWRQHPGSGPARWALAAFVLLELVVVQVIVTEVWGIELGVWWTKGLLAILVFFPYSLFRFSRSFEGKTALQDRLALGATVLLSLTALVLPDLENETTTGAIRYYLFGVMVQWTVLSIAAAVRLWRAGSDLPAVARRRMRLMGGATIALNGAIVLTLVPEEALIGPPIQGLLFVTALLFLCGLAPPAFLRHHWRQSDRDNFQTTVTRLMGASSREAVGEILLRDAVAMVGAEGGQLIDADGRVIAETGSVDRQTSEGITERVDLGAKGISLVARLGPYAPYFGADELDILRTTGALAAVSLERNALFEEQAEVVDTLRSEIAQRVRIESELRDARGQADRANRAKNDFLSRMSHELRTPLNSILGYSQLLEMDGLVDEQRDGVTQIRRAGRHLLDLINEVLDLSRIESGSLSLSLEPVNAQELLQECIALVEPMAADRQIQLRLEHESLQPAHVLADRQRLKQVVLNLLSNAIKYNRSAGSVTVSCSPREDSMLEIAVTDTGPGIPANKIDRLFTAFDRLDIPDEQEEGTGLGLSVANNLMKLMQGRLDVTSEIGVGSRFILSLPTTKERYGNGEKEVAPSPGPRLYGAKRVLCIEDNAANVTLLEKILKLRPQVTLHAVLTGSEGMEAAKGLRPALILLDVNLPDLEGGTVLHRLRADPGTRDIPVVVVSADATDRQIQRLIESGAYAYLTKPLDVGEFLATIDEVLGQELSDAGR